MPKSGNFSPAFLGSLTPATTPFLKSLITSRTAPMIYVKNRICSVVLLVYQILYFYVRNRFVLSQPTAWLQSLTQRCVRNKKSPVGAGFPLRTLGPENIKMCKIPPKICLKMCKIKRNSLYFCVKIS